MISAAFVVWATLVAASPIAAQIRAVAALSGDPAIVSAAGETRDDVPILTLENSGAFDPTTTRRRLILIGTRDGGARGADAVLAAVRWFKTRASAAARRGWTISALPSPRFDAADASSLPRWLTFQAPDLVVTIGGEDAAMRDGLETVPHMAIAAPDPVPALAKILSTPIGRSALHAELIARVQREPIVIARLLAARYPDTPSISYIPAVAWVSTLRLGDDWLRRKVLDQIAPWLSGDRKMFGDRIQLTSVAGAMVFAELAKAGGNEAATTLAADAAALAAARKPDGTAQYGAGWTDDMFMAGSILSRAGLLPGRSADVGRAAERLTEYASRLQRPDGVFNHAIDGPFAWGRGNGFAALGLIEVLTVIPADDPARPALLGIYRRQMAAAKRHQAPDGMWRQIIDAPGAYREESATAMLTTAMARGVRLGWIDASYQPAVERAWRALAAHIAGDGTVIDVCASTGAGPTRRYYFDRPAVTGADDRGGAMALLAAMEIAMEMK